MVCQQANGIISRWWLWLTQSGMNKTCKLERGERLFPFFHHIFAGIPSCLLFSWIYPLYSTSASFQLRKSKGNCLNLILIYFCALLLKGNQQWSLHASFSSATEQRVMSRQGKSFQLLVLLSQGQIPLNCFSSRSLWLSKGMPGTEECGYNSASSAGEFALLCDSGAVTVCIQCILQIQCKKSGDNIRNSQSSEPYLLFVSLAPGIPGEVLPLFIPNSTFIGRSWMLLHSVLCKWAKSGDCELGQFSLWNSLSLQGCGSFFLCQKWQQQGHGAALTLLVLRSLSELWETEVDLSRDLGECCQPDGREKGGPSFCCWRMSWALRWWALGQCHIERYWAKHPLLPGCCPVSAQEVGSLGNWDLLLLSDHLGMHTKKKKHCLLMCFHRQI